MLARFFKPNWLHAKPAKRIKAITQLNENLADDQAIISRLAAQDQDDSVRLAAIEKLHSLSQLISISTRDPSEANKQQALHSISKILLKSTSITLDDKSGALSSIHNNDLLIHLILNSTEERLRLEALGKLNDPAHLATIIRESQRSAIRVAAAERLNCQATLEEINKEARNKDKGVFRASRDKLNHIKEQQKQLAENQHKVIEVLEAIQHLSAHQDTPLYAAKLTAIQKDWSALASDISSVQQEQFNSNEKCCFLFIEQQQKAEDEKTALIALQKEQQKIRTTLINSFSDLSQYLKTPVANVDELLHHETTIKELLAQWNEVSDGDTKNKFTEIDPYISFAKISIAAQRNLFSLNKDIDTLSCELKNQLSSSGSSCEALPAAQRLLKKLQWPQQLDKPASLADLESLLDKALSRHQKSTQKHQQKHQQKQQELDSQLNELSSAISQGEIKSADKQLKKAEQLSKQLNGNLPNHLDLRLKQLIAELQEIRSWQSYAVTPKKEALCAAMEELCDSNIEIQERSNQIKKIQKEWKLLDATDSEHSQTLWKRFKKASDLAYAPCDQYFSDQRQLRIENLKHREEICQQLNEAVQQSQQEDPNWKEIEEGIRNAKQAWRTYTPVDRAPGKKIQQIFEKLISQLEDPLKQYRAENGKEKLLIAERTEALLQTDDLISATQEIKELQQRWKELGPASRNQERKLWSRFRENSSLIFERFHANGGQDSSQKNSLDNSLEINCCDLEKLQQSASSIDEMEKAVAKVKANVMRLKQEGHDLTAEHLSRIDLACEFVEQQKLDLSQLLTAPYEAFQRKAILCEQLELAILENCANERLPSLQKAWQQGPSIPEDIDQAINTRFSTLLQITESPALLEKIVAEQEVRLRQLCIRIEIANSQSSPSEDQALRMEYQMQRIQQALEQQTQAFSLADIKRLEYEWLCIPFAGHFEELHQRFDKQLKKIF